jgi:hypothetical protein
MTSASSTWESAAITHLSKLQRLQNNSLRATGKFKNCAQVREWHVAFQVPFIYDYINKLCRQQAEDLQSHKNANICDIGKGETQHRKYKKLKLGDAQAYDRLSDQAAVVTSAT